MDPSIKIFVREALKHIEEKSKENIKQEGEPDRYGNIITSYYQYIQIYYNGNSCNNLDTTKYNLDDLSHEYPDYEIWKGYDRMLVERENNK